jgi:hypothetical protein
LTRPGHLGAFLVAHLDRSEDPADLYRAWVPERSVLHARTTGRVNLRLLRRAPRNAKRSPALAVAKAGAVAYRNATAHGAYVYVELRPATRVAAYTLRITTARR